jgi:hypothetical protein
MPVISPAGKKEAFSLGSIFEVVAPVEHFAPEGEVADLLNHITGVHALNWFVNRGEAMHLCRCWLFRQYPEELRDLFRLVCSGTMNPQEIADKAGELFAELTKKFQSASVEVESIIVEG